MSYLYRERILSQMSHQHKSVFYWGSHSYCFIAY